MSKFETFVFMYRRGVNSTDDLRAECQRLLTIAKGILESGKQLMPVGFIVKPDGTLDLYQRNTEPGSWKKDASHKLLSSEAKRVNANAVILLSDIWYRALEDMNPVTAEAYISNYRQGQVSEDPKRREALHLFAFGPGINYYVLCFYHRAAGGKCIVWDETVDSTQHSEIFKQLQQSLLEPWWDTSKQPTAS